MKEYTDTVIIGGGQAGLAVSCYLTHQGRSHVVLEQSPQPANAWRNQRWDSFTFVTPNWMTGLPGTEYHGPDPNAFMSRSEIVTFFEQYVECLDLTSAGVQSVIWATGFTFDFSLVRLPVLDSDGYPIQKRGVTKYAGLYFVGLPWIHNAKSGLLFGVGEDAAFIAANIEARKR